MEEETRSITFDDLTETVPDFMRPPLDRWNVVFTSLDQLHWRNHGFLVKPKFIPDSLIDVYVEARQEHGEWSIGTPYMHVPEIRCLCLYWPLMRLLEHLIGEPMAMHLNLTGWVSTERNWHQDDYLNPEFVCCHYAAVWFALDVIHPDSGPFQFVPGSHKWPWLRRDKVLAFANGSDPSWPKETESFVVPAIEQKMQDENAIVSTWVPRKGDILIWHAGLVHRGSTPRQPGLERRSLITHYSAIAKRKDMPTVHPDGYFVFTEDNQ